MRLEGLTYSQIKAVLPVAKSTLCEWFKDLPYPEHTYFTNRSAWMEHIRELSARSKRNTRIKKEEQIIARVKDEVGSWSNLSSVEMQKSLLAMLYWAEGQKSPELNCPVKFANTDPRLCLLFVTLLRNCYKIDESKLRIRIYVHWYHNIKDIISYWSNLLRVDKSLFSRTYYKKRSLKKRFRKNFAGICFITYFSVDLRREIIATAYNIQELFADKNNFSALVA